MDQDQLVTREQKREFFIQIPAFVDYLALTAHEFRLYTHYLRVCGDSGECWESVRTTAANCNIGRGTVTNARYVLEDKFQLIYTNKKQLDELDTDKQTQIHIKIRDVWEINSRFLTLLRKHGMPSLEAARTWLHYQLTQEIDTSPFDAKKKTKFGVDSPDIHFSIPCPSGGHPVHDMDTCPSGGHPVHVMDTCPSGGHGARQVDTCPPDGHNKIYNKQISLNQIPFNEILEKQIPVNAAAAGGSFFVSEGNASELTPRVEIGEALFDELADDRIWWNVANQLLSRAAVEQTCREYMALDDWRDQVNVIEDADTGELFNLLLWLHYANWNGVNMMENGIRNVPGYIRKRYKDLRDRPQYSKRDIEEITARIHAYQSGVSDGRVEY